MEDRMLSDEILLALIKKAGSGTDDYEDLENKPQIGGVELSGNKSLADLDIASAQSVSEIKDGQEINSFADVETALAGKADNDIVADAFSAAETYAEGDYCTYEGGLYKFKTAHEGAWDAADVDRIKIAGELSELKNTLTNDTTYPYADAITIEDAVPANLADCSVKIEPVQDLHGYDKPWAGGENIQLIDFSNYQELSPNITFDYTDGDVTLRSTGTTPVYSFAVYNIESLKGKTLYFANTFSRSDLGLGHIQIVYSIGGQSTYLEIGREPNPQTGYSIPSNAEIVLFRLCLCNGVSVESGKWVKYGKIMCASSANPTYSPYSNICPITGHTEASVEVTDGDETTKTYTIALGDTIYGGTVDFNTGVMTVTMAQIASYDGEIIGDPWISDRDAYEEGATPTTGAQVVYTLATPTTIQLTPKQIQLLKGQNTITASTGDISVTVNGVSGAIGQVQEQVNATDAALAELAEQIPTAPTADGAYVLTVTVADGTPTYSWESGS